MNTSYGSYKLLQKYFGQPNGVKKTEADQDNKALFSRLSQPKRIKHDYYRRQCIKAVTQKMMHSQPYKRGQARGNRARAQSMDISKEPFYMKLCLMNARVRMFQKCFAEGRAPSFT